MLVDEITIRIEAGKGGDGIVSFNKNKMTLGPAGGSGGLGGSVYLIGVSDLGALNSLRNQKVFKAEAGQRGRHQLNDGNDGEDLTIRVPVGTVAHNLTTKTDHEIIQIGERYLVAKGGKGGKGNFHFRGPHHTTPMKYQKGLPAEIFNVRLELKMIADVGLIGLPNVGKSSLINELTRANSKVANYPFTTLEPHLGVYYDLILADIPGLIEGASTGRGLGIKFLRHVERTRVLFHLVSAESEDPVADYKAIRKELGTYNEGMLDKKEFLFLSKTDLTNQKDLKKKITQLKKLNRTATLLSIHDTDAIGSVQKILNAIAEQKNVSS